MCRDFAHLTTCLLRAMDVPARLAAVSAPGLSPMDVHAVVEGYVDGGWWVVDATHLAPRRSMLRISTGRDAADTAFLSAHRPPDNRQLRVAVTSRYSQSIAKAPSPRRNRVARAARSASSAAVLSGSSAIALYTAIVGP
ncbi:MAG: transglutaminase [Actinotalea sp.]|nr:transglutaminase [Actinotalea sp.]